MKNLFGIVVLGLLLSGSAYAELITLTKCYITSLSESGSDEAYTSKYEYNSWKEQNSDQPSPGIYRVQYENRLYTLDTVTEVITSTIVNRDSYIKRMKKNNNLVVKKFDKIQFQIVDLGGNVATGESMDKCSFQTKHTIDVDFVSNVVYTYMKSDYGNGVKSTTSFTEKCQRQK